MRLQILYTHQKQKKRKTWQDGYLTVGENRMASVFDDHDKKIDSLFIKQDQLVEDSIIESDKFLIQIESLEETMATIVNKENEKPKETPLVEAVKKSICKTKPFRPVFARPGLKRPISARDVNDERRNHQQKPRNDPKSEFQKTIITEYNESIKIKSHPTTYTPDIHFVNTKRSCDDILAFFSSPLSDPTDVIKGDVLLDDVKISTLLNTTDTLLTNSKNKNNIFADDIESHSPRETFFDEFDDVSDIYDNDLKAPVFPNINDAECKRLRQQSNGVSNKKSKWSMFEESSDDENSFENSNHTINEAIRINDNRYESITSSKTDAPIITNDTINEPIKSNDNRYEPITRRSKTDVPITINDSPKHSKEIFHPNTGSNINRVFSRPSVNNVASFIFPTVEECLNKPLPRRTKQINLQFNSLHDYKQTLEYVLKEHLNILIFQLAVKYYETLRTVDMTSLAPAHNFIISNDVPKCKHNLPSKMKSVRKENKNQGRCFYACAKPKGQECGFFVWLDDVTKSPNDNRETSKGKINDPRHANVIFNSRNVELYCNCRLVRKMSYYNKAGGFRKNKLQDARKKSLYIVLPFKKHSSSYNKLDLWIVTTSFDFKHYFVAKSLFYGPNQACEVEIEPIIPISNSDWSDGITCHAIQAFNASSEITCIENIENCVNQFDVPILNNLLTNNKGIPRSIYSCLGNCALLHDEIYSLIDNMVSTFSLNIDQSTALETIGNMFSKNASDPITLIHGVFGSGKSYLLSVAVLFLIQLFEIIESKTKMADKIRLLIASSTNVAVDRVLSGLLHLQFEDFVRVGSVKKIARPILPYSIHASENKDQEVKELNELLRSEISESEKGYVKKALEQHKLGVNKKKLANTRVVGITCASCMCPYVNQMRFQVQLLDECSQMTEPTSLLPIGRFRCERLILVGDPNQLPPTIQGSEADHEHSLEQTMFDRLQKQGRKPVILCTQYRCHPKISAVCNKLFYNGVLKDGIADGDRMNMLGNFPTLSFVDINLGKEKCESDGSYSNQKEAEFLVSVVTSLLRNDIPANEIGIITQYRSQVKIIGQLLSHDMARDDWKEIQVSTVDAFQGAEKEIILLSCVRTRNIGFIDCPRRTNVSLSRAKRHLLIVGHYELLKTNRVWGEVIRTCRESDTLYRSGNDFLNYLNMS